MIERAYIEQLKSRIEEPRNLIQVINGPRQVGKTTLISQILQKISPGESFAGGSWRNWDRRFPED